MICIIYFDAYITYIIHNILIYTQAKIFEASEIVVTSSQEELCTSYGATKVYNYKDKELDWFKEMEGKEFDIAYDCVGGKEHWEKAQKILKKSGKFVTIIGDLGSTKATTGKLVSIGLGVVNRKFWSNFGHQDYEFVSVNGASDSLKKLMKLVGEDKIKVPLDEDSPFSLDNFRNAFEKSSQHKAHGKLVIEMKGGTIETLEDAKDANEKDEAKKDESETTKEVEKNDENENEKEKETMKSAANDEDDATAAANETQEDAKQTEPENAGDA